MSDEATARPWRFREWEGLPVIDFPDTRVLVGDTAKAEYFRQAVRAVNTYNAALSALRDCREHIQYELNTSNGLQQFRDEECSLLIARIDALLAPDGQAKKEG